MSEHGTKIGVWEAVPSLYGGSGYHCIFGKNVRITLAPRPGYCDRGNWIARVDAWGNKLEQILDCYVDAADGWPRYYFDEARAKLEIEAWLRKRGQIP